MGQIIDKNNENKNNVENKNEDKIKNENEINKRDTNPINNPINKSVTLLTYKWSEVYKNPINNYNAPDWKKSIKYITSECKNFITIPETKSLVNSIALVYLLRMY